MNFKIISILLLFCPLSALAGAQQAKQLAPTAVFLGAILTGPGAIGYAAAAAINTKIALEAAQRAQAQQEAQNQAQAQQAQKERDDRNDQNFKQAYESAQEKMNDLKNKEKETKEEHAKTGAEKLLNQYIELFRKTESPMMKEKIAAFILMYDFNNAEAIDYLKNVCGLSQEKIDELRRKSPFYTE